MQRQKWILISTFLLLFTSVSIQVLFQSGFPYIYFLHVILIVVIAICQISLYIDKKKCRSNWNNLGTRFIYAIALLLFIGLISLTSFLCLLTSPTPESKLEILVNYHPIWFLLSLILLLHIGGYREYKKHEINFAIKNNIESKIKIDLNDTKVKNGSSNKKITKDNALDIALNYENIDSIITLLKNENEIAETIINRILSLENVKAISFLIEKMATVTEETYEYLIVCSIRKGVKDFINTHIEIGYSVEKTLKNINRSIIQEAATNGTEEILQHTLNFSNIDILDKDGNTLLHYACNTKIKYTYQDSYNKIKLLNNISPNTKNHDGVTPTMLASGFYSPEIIKYMISIGGDISIKDYFGNSILHYSINEYQEYDTIEFLLKNGSPPQSPSHEKRNPISILFPYKLDIATLLINNKTYPGLKDFEHLISNPYGLKSMGDFLTENINSFPKETQFGVIDTLFKTDNKDLSDLRDKLLTQYIESGNSIHNRIEFSPYSLLESVLLSKGTGYKDIFPFLDTNTAPLTIIFENYDSSPISDMQSELEKKVGFFLNACEVDRYRTPEVIKSAIDNNINTRIIIELINKITPEKDSLNSIFPSSPALYLIQKKRVRLLKDFVDLNLIELDINHKLENGLTPLENAISTADIDTISEILNLKPNTITFDKFNNTPLDLYAKYMYQVYGDDDNYKLRQIASTLFDNYKELAENDESELQFRMGKYYLGEYKYIGEENYYYAERWFYKAHENQHPLAESWLREIYAIEDKLFKNEDGEPLAKYAYYEYRNTCNCDVIIDIDSEHLSLISSGKNNNNNTNNSNNNNNNLLNFVIKLKDKTTIEGGLYPNKTTRIAVYSNSESYPEEISKVRNQQFGISLPSGESYQNTLIDNNIPVLKKFDIGMAFIKFKT